MHCHQQASSWEPRSQGPWDGGNLCTAANPTLPSALLLSRHSMGLGGFARTEFHSKQILGARTFQNTLLSCSRKMPTAACAFGNQTEAMFIHFTGEQQQLWKETARVPTSYIQLWPVPPFWWCQHFKLSSPPAQEPSGSTVIFQPLFP